MSRRGCSLPANASGFDPHRASISSRFGQVRAARRARDATAHSAAAVIFGNGHVAELQPRQWRSEHIGQGSFGTVHRARCEATLVFFGLRARVEIMGLIMARTD
jgi:hypothetical protein